MIDAKSLRTLEFDKIGEMLASKAASPMGKQLSLEISPLEDIYEAETALSETEASCALIMRKGSLPLGGISDIKAFISRAVIGGSLSMGELLNIADFVYVCRKVVKYGLSDDERGDKPAAGALASLFRLISVETSLENAIRRCIMNDNEMYDDASPKLAEIRRGIKRAGERVREALNNIIRSPAYKTALQDSVITTRGGRYCVPVKSEMLKAVPGMVHDQSGSGATFYVEPMSVVEQNNTLRELAAKERDEIDRILSELSDLAAERADVLTASLESMTLLDFIFAKGELALSMNATRPRLNARGYLNLVKARHPLISKDIVVPINIYVGDEFTTLLITGPNTGGKTVTLKTAGLLTLMGSAGLFIPASEGSELCVFNGVFADIGDEQSIEQSLSTFSGHMTNITRILGLASPDSIILLDELCAGTDPTEGAALAEAIIEKLSNMGARVIVTTHYSELKLYALSNARARNAACEFDVETLRPTYRLMIGIPGKSNAFAISKRLGLSDEIIESAKSALSHSQLRFEDIVTDLEINRKSAEIEKERAEAIRRDAEEIKREYEAAKQKIMLMRDKEMKSARVEARAIVERAKEEASAIIKEIRKMADERAAVHKLEEKRRSLSESLAAIEDVSDEASEQNGFPPANMNLKPGDSVYIRSLGQRAIVTTAPDSGGGLFVTAGAIKIKTNINNLSLDLSVTKPPKFHGSSSHTTTVLRDKSLNISPEIDLRGLSVAEALERVDKYLDDAAIANLAQVGLIHGKGTGALRQAITEHLRYHSHVRRYRLGGFGEGDSGVTIVEIK